MTQAITFGRETYEYFVTDEFKAFLPIHYNELAVHQDAIPLDPDWTRYEAMNKAGILHIFAARTEDNQLIGYIIGTLSTGLHYKSTNTYINDIYYLSQEYRNSGIGIRMFKAFEKHLESLNVHRVVMLTKMHSDKGKLFEYLGYGKTDEVYDKML